MDAFYLSFEQAKTPDHLRSLYRRTQSREHALRRLHGAPVIDRLLLDFPKQYRMMHAKAAVMGISLEEQTDAT